MVGQTIPEMTLPAGLACSEIDGPLVSCMGWPALANALGDRHLRPEPSGLARLSDQT